MKKRLLKNFDCDTSNPFMKLMADVVFERILLPIVHRIVSNNQDAKASEGDSPRMSESTISAMAYIVEYKEF